MGYDMTTVTIDEGEAARAEDLRTRIRTAYDEGRRHDADKLREELRAAERSYFRLNIWGMGEARQIMDRAGMLDLHRPEAARWPKDEDHGVTPEMWNDWDGEPDDKTPAELRAYLAACAVVTDSQRDVPTGIPLHKLGTNDGWLVTPDEIGAALAALGDKQLPDAPQWWAAWVDWLRYAQAHGGFRVN